MAEVILEDVGKQFSGGIDAVRHVSLTVSDREFVVLVGPSGCGKSTTLRLIAGLEDVSHGTIRIGGRVVNHVAPRDRDVAMVFQNYALYPHMNVYRNLAFGLELRSGASWQRTAIFRIVWPPRGRKLAQVRREIDLRVRTTAEMLGIAGLLDRQPRQLSGGERQRVALGRAIVREPKVFLFDEPLSNLDARLRVEMRRELKDLHRRLAATMIYVTHDQVEAMTLGQRLVVMHQGVVQQVGTPLEVYDRPNNQFVAQFIGSPPMNLLEGRIELGSAGCSIQAEWGGATVDRPQVDRLQQYAGRRVVLGLRAEDVHLVDGSSTGSSTGADPAGVGPTLDALVSVVEPLGDMAWVQTELTRGGAARAEPVRVIGKASARNGLNSGDRVRVVFDMRRAHWFDADSGINVSLAPLA